ncbi:MAG: YezD family protein [Chlorobium sp.]
MNRKSRELEPHIVSEIMRCIGDISYGEVVVTIHDARIVQVEKREKRRFDLCAAGNGRLKYKQGEAVLDRHEG